MFFLIGLLAANASAGFFGPAKKKKDAFGEANAVKAKEYSEKARAHAPVKDGACSKCHTDSASPSKMLLAGKALCLSCHADRAKDMEKAVVHSPFKEMECDTCHVPHSSDNHPLLSAPVKELCTNCHDATEDPVKSGHNGIKVFAGACTDCHNPHASKNAKLILEAKEHVPFGSRSCEMCHDKPDPDGKLTLKEMPGATCYVCHSNFRKLAANPVVHAPASGGDCATCHNPHISARGSLIRKPLAEICFECHDGSIADNHPVTRHPIGRGNVADPRREGKPYDCASCHRPHAGENPKLMRADFYVLCSECHKK